MARLSKPTIMKELAGNPGKRSLNKKEAKPQGEAVAPKILPASAKKIFARIVGQMPKGVITAADEAIVASLAWAIMQRDMAISEMQHQDTIVTGSKGQDALNPLLGHINKQTEIIKGLAARLGLDPISRSQIQVGADDHDDDGGFNIH